MFRKSIFWNLERVEENVTYSSMETFDFNVLLPEMKLEVDTHYDMLDRVMLGMTSRTFYTRYRPMVCESIETFSMQYSRIIGRCGYDKLLKFLNKTLVWEIEPRLFKEAFRMGHVFMLKYIKAPKYGQFRPILSLSRINKQKSILDNSVVFFKWIVTSPYAMKYQSFVEECIPKEYRTIAIHEHKFAKSSMHMAVLDPDKQSLFVHDVPSMENLYPIFAKAVRSGNLALVSRIVDTYPITKDDLELHLLPEASIKTSGKMLDFLDAKKLLVRFTPSLRSLMRSADRETYIKYFGEAFIVSALPSQRMGIALDGSIFRPIFPDINRVIIEARCAEDFTEILGFITWMSTMKAKYHTSIINSDFCATVDLNTVASMLCHMSSNLFRCTPDEEWQLLHKAMDFFDTLLGHNWSIMIQERTLFDENFCTIRFSLKIAFFDWCFAHGVQFFPGIDNYQCLTLLSLKITKHHGHKVPSLCISRHPDFGRRLLETIVSGMETGLIPFSLDILCCVFKHIPLVVDVIPALKRLVNAFGKLWRHTNSRDLLTSTFNQYNGTNDFVKRGPDITSIPVRRDIVDILRILIPLEIARYGEDEVAFCLAHLPFDDIITLLSNKVPITIHHIRHFCICIMRHVHATGRLVFDGLEERVLFIAQHWAIRDTKIEYDDIIPKLHGNWTWSAYSALLLAIGKIYLPKSRPIEQCVLGLIQERAYKVVQDHPTIKHALIDFYCKHKKVSLVGLVHVKDADIYDRQ